MLLNACKAAGRRFPYRIYPFIAEPRRDEIPDGRITFRLDWAETGPLRCHPESSTESDIQRFDAHMLRIGAREDERQLKLTRKRTEPVLGHEGEAGVGLAGAAVAGLGKRVVGGARVFE